MVGVRNVPAAPIAVAILGKFEGGSTSIAVVLYRITIATYISSVQPDLF